MNKIYLIGIIAVCLILIGGGIFLINYKPQEKENVNDELLGSGCGTVTPGYNDECCYRKLKETGLPGCAGVLIFYNFEEQKCDFECGGSIDIVCAEDAKQCPDGTWTSRTPALNCEFIPCGYN
jgi:hypothetical protein